MRCEPLTPTTHRIVRQLALVAGIACGLALETTAQNGTFQLVAGDRVRVSTPRPDVGHLVGTYVTTDGARIAVRPELRTDTVWMPLAGDATVQVHLGTRGYTERGTVIGGLAGMVAGAAIAVLAFAPSCDGWECLTWSLFERPALRAAAGGTALGVVGALAGAAIGSLIATDRWETVPVNRVRFGVHAERRGGMSVGLSVKF